MTAVPEGALVFFPIQPTVTPCGLAGIVAFKKPQAAAPPKDLAALAALLDTCAANGFATSRSANRATPRDPVIPTNRIWEDAPSGNRRSRTSRNPNACCLCSAGPNCPMMPVTRKGLPLSAARVGH